MKTLTLTLAATLLTIIATPKSAKASTVDGHWNLVARECSSGTPARDRFNINKDYMKLVFERGGLLMPASVLDGQEIMIATGKVNVVGSRVQLEILELVTEQGVIMPNSPNTSHQIVEGVLSTDGQMFQIVTSGFGKGGTCPEGDSLSLTFQRENRY